MNRVFLGVLFCVLFTAAHAGGYDYFARGISAIDQNNPDAAISLFTSALAAGDLTPAQQRTALLDRGVSYLGKGECSEALSDLSAALKLKPDDSDTIYGKISAEECLGKFAAANDDMTKEIARGADFRGYFERSQARYFMGDYAGAEDDLKQAIKLDPTDAYPAVWLGLAELRTGKIDADAFRGYLSEMQLHKWPGPLIQMLLGEETPEDAVKAAADSGKKGQKCEADFYVAEHHLIWQQPAAAKPMLEDAVQICPDNFLEKDAARAALAQLK